MDVFKMDRQKMAIKILNKKTKKRKLNMGIKKLF